MASRAATNRVEAEANVSVQVVPRISPLCLFSLLTSSTSLFANYWKAPLSFFFFFAPPTASHPPLREGETAEDARQEKWTKPLEELNHVRLNRRLEKEKNTFFSLALPSFTPPPSLTHHLKTKKKWNKKGSEVHDQIVSLSSVKLPVHKWRWGEEERAHWSTSRLLLLPPQSWDSHPPSLTLLAATRRCSSPDPGSGSGSATTLHLVNI